MHNRIIIIYIYNIAGINKRQQRERRKKQFLTGRQPISIHVSLCDTLILHIVVSHSCHHRRRRCRRWEGIVTSHNILVYVHIRMNSGGTMSTLIFAMRWSTQTHTHIPWRMSESLAWELEKMKMKLALCLPIYSEHPIHTTHTTYAHATAQQNKKFPQSLVRSRRHTFSIQD